VRGTFLSLGTIDAARAAPAWSIESSGNRGGVGRKGVECGELEILTPVAPGPVSPNAVNESRPQRRRAGPPHQRPAQPQLAEFHAPKSRLGVRSRRARTGRKARAWLSPPGSARRGVQKRVSARRADRSARTPHASFPRKRVSARRAERSALNTPARRADRSALNTPARRAERSALNTPARRAERSDRTPHASFPRKRVSARRAERSARTPHASFPRKRVSALRAGGPNGAL